MNFLGLDYGLQHIGIAIATTPLAEPLMTATPATLAGILNRLISRHQIDMIVVGLSENQMALNTLDFVQKLGKQVAVPVVTHDETLSSQEALELLRHKTRKKRRNDHQYAAALMLQDYLDQQLAK